MAATRGLGYNVVKNRSDSVKDDLGNAPKGEVLGEVRAKGPAVTAWTDPETQQLVEMEEGPAPWELAQGPNASDARNYLTCPDEWVLYWINPKLLDAAGWRGWTHVRAKDQRVKVLVPSMVDPTGMIRRGGTNGDILAYMPKHWYESRKQQFKESTERLTQSSLDRIETLKEEFARGRYGQNVVLESAKHPTHTIADGRTMIDP